MCKVPVVCEGEAGGSSQRAQGALELVGSGREEAMMIEGVVEGGSIEVVLALRIVASNSILADCILNDRAVGFSNCCHNKGTWRGLSGNRRRRCSDAKSKHSK